MFHTVDDSVYVGPDAMVLGNAVLKGNVRVEDRAVVANRVTAFDNVVISRHAIINGGGWVYDNGWVQQKDGAISGYDFSVKSDVWATDTNAASSALIKGATWQSERTSASVVLNFDGIDDYAVIDSSAVLPKGSKTNQEVLHFGDSNSYMSFTPKNQDGETVKKNSFSKHSV